MGEREHDVTRPAAPSFETTKALIYWASVPVPYAVSWTAEEDFYLAPCPYINGRMAICQRVARGVGKPRFGKPHAQRQRELIALDLCDLCGKSLKISTKVSLSHARPQAHAHKAGDILQVEPLLHRSCAATSIRHCPALKRDVASGSVQIRQVTRHDVQFSLMDEIYTAEMTGRAVKAIGHAKVHLLRWIDRDLDWLTRPRP